MVSPPKVAALAAMALALSGCAGLGIGLTSSFCNPRTHITPLRFSPRELAVMSHDNLVDTVNINQFGADNCAATNPAWKK